jgi:hypothetical protein
MDWNAAVAKHRERLKLVLVTLLAMAGMGGEGPILLGHGASLTKTLPRRLHLAVLRLLRPAEAAARRLIIVAARGIVVTLKPPKPKKPKPRKETSFATKSGTGIVLPRGFRLGPPRPLLSLSKGRVLSLRLTDPPRRVLGRRPAAAPRILAVGFPEPFRIPVRAPVRQPPSPNDPIDATRIGLRLSALAGALDDLPGQALRFARWRARRDAGRVRWRWPLWLGRHSRARLLGAGKARHVMTQPVRTRRRRDRPSGGFPRRGGDQRCPRVASRLPKPVNPE